MGTGDRETLDPTALYRHVDREATWRWQTEDNGGVSEFLWKKVEQLTQVGNDEEMHEIWKNCYDEYMEPLIKNKYDGNDCGFVPTLDVVGTVLDNTLKQKPVEWIGTEEKQKSIF